ncbi:MAG TPA: hypothetical protein VJK72_02230 [Candidatus Nanoarchaeia archaeon]|nr:hypothetical protein [Candidatus Nanoarchaeia archaeon]
MNLEQRTLTLSKQCKKSVTEVCKLYAKIAREPKLIVKGTYQVVKDIVYELPKSIIAPRQKTREERLSEKASQALTLSEVVAIGGSFAGAATFKACDTDDYTAAVIGSSVGNYIAGALSYVGFYATLTRNVEKYESLQAVREGARVVRDGFLTALTLYITEAPLVAGLIITGFSTNIAVAVNATLCTIIFTGVAKTSSLTNYQNT